MSFFYLTAVKGEIPAHLLETISLERFRYLQAISKGDYSEYNEYLVEGSVYDNVGHFLLCVVTIMLKNVEMTNFFKNTEIKLFRRRIEALNAYELRCFARKLLRSIRKQVTVPTFIDALKLICEHVKLKELAHHICCPNHSQSCTSHFASCNFRHCLPFIAKRKVDLVGGLARIPCGKWKEFLTMLFSTNLYYRLKNTNLDSLNSDPRLSELLIKINNEIKIFMNYTQGNEVLRSMNVNKTSIKFPPCMLNLHQQLRQKHRLSHTQRFYYSLFLKDIGMPVEESIEFWRSEYRQDPKGSATCCHHWEKDEKKFLYGIRHMYGLEGRRKSYPSVNCQRIQSLDSTSSEGGCPFKAFESKKLLQLLNMKHTDEVYIKIDQLKSRHCYTNACMKYLQSHTDSPDGYIPTPSFNFTPVKYYLSFIKKIDT